jgi:hypothetical protein
MRLLRLTGLPSVALGLISIRLRREAQRTGRLQPWCLRAGHNAFPGRKGAQVLPGGLE